MHASVPRFNLGIGIKMTAPEGRGHFKNYLIFDLRRKAGTGASY